MLLSPILSTYNNKHAFQHTEHSLALRPRKTNKKRQKKTNTTKAKRENCGKKNHLKLHLVLFTCSFFLLHVLLLFKPICIQNRFCFLFSDISLFFLFYSVLTALHFSFAILAHQTNFLAFDSRRLSVD